MNLEALLQIEVLESGGVGSGCRGPNCGRKATGRNKVENQRHKDPRLKDPKDPKLSRIAKENYVGTNRQDKLESEARQKEFASWFPRGLAKSLPDQKPFDALVKGKALVEVKYKPRGKKNEVNHHRDALGRKYADAKAKGLPIYTMVFDERKGKGNRDLYICEGICWGLNAMSKFKDPRDVVTFIMKPYGGKK